MAAAAAAIAKVLQAVGAGDLIAKLFDKLTKDKTPEEKARGPLRDLYGSLIYLGDARKILYQAILDRLSDPTADKKEYSKPPRVEWPESYKRVRRESSQAGQALAELKSSLNRIQVDLDYQDPQLLASLNQYRISGQAGTLLLGVDPTDLEQMKTLKKEMEKNNKVLDEALDQLRTLTRKYYPTLGALMK